MHNISSKLDWNRMLGFEQIADRRVLDQEGVAKVGVKFGAKLGGKIGVKSGLKS